MRKVLLVVLLVSLFVSCGQRKRRSVDAVEVQNNSVSVIKKFPTADIPTTISDNLQRVEYLAEHYWGKFDFTNIGYVNNEDVTEQGYVDFLGVLQALPDKSIRDKCISALMERARVNSDMYDYFWELSDKYLYDPNSPMRNEDMYIVVLNSIIANPDIEDIMKIVSKERLAKAMQNRVGDRANNFSYTTSKGKKGSLYDIKAEYTIVYFYNLGCPMCREVREGMEYILNQPPFASLYKAGKIKVLALYPDEDMEGWDDYLGDIPAEWINGYDRGKDAKNKYDLKAIPSVYLLDKDKKVLFKDAATAVQVFEALEAQMAL